MAMVSPTQTFAAAGCGLDMRETANANFASPQVTLTQSDSDCKPTRLVPQPGKRLSASTLDKKAAHSTKGLRTLCAAELPCSLCSVSMRILCHGRLRSPFFFLVLPHFFVETRWREKGELGTGNSVRDVKKAAQGGILFLHIWR